MKPSFRRALIGLVLLGAGLLWLGARTAPVQAASSIQVSGIWSETIDQTDLLQGAGSELPPTVESAPDAFRFSLTGVGAKNWRVDVRKADTQWHAALSLLIRRTSDGTGQGTIAGGTTYQPVLATEQPFCQGSQNRQSVLAQAKISGLSLALPPNTYTTTLVLTVVEL